MMKQFTVRFLNGFCYSIAVTLIIQLLAITIWGEIPLLPEYAAHFSSQLSAFACQLLLIGIMSGITSAGTLVLEAKKISMVAQSILFIAIMLSVWIPVACFAWGFHKYTASMITTLCSIVVTYGICRGIQYRLCRKDIEAINERLSEKKG